MKPLSDIQINSYVRKVLVRHWIDLGLISMRTARGHVTLHGSLLKLPNSPGKLVPASLDAIVREIKKIPCVHKVSIQLDNWQLVNGVWTPVLPEREREKPAAAAAAAPADAAGVTVDLNRWARETTRRLDTDEQSPPAGGIPRGLPDA
ncbi:MAG: hypothetical protein JXR37_24885 [Kiritimatiellae bacterium]|nr:hypothetical protein [Kiritimatiellia bacterium]